MVVIEPQTSALLDPFHAHSVLSLFPRTFKEPPIANDSDNLQSIHSYMKSMVLRSPSKLLDKAEGIVRGGSELLNSKLASLAASDTSSEAAVMGMGNPKERRPALGCKRARFMLKPDKSQPSVNLESCLDIDQLQDPEQFFSAYEKLEYAEEEIQRQKGGNITGKREYDPSANPRRRRPGILGKSSIYKHHYSSVVSENDDTLISSQEILQLDNLSPSNFDSQQETANPNVASQERELAGSIANTENRVNELLDELLSRNIENLDGEGALSLLQECLQIKPVDIDKYLPDLSNDIGRADLMDFEEELPKSRKKLSDIQNVMTGLSGKTPVKHKRVTEISFHSLASPTPPKSPFAALSLLKKRISKSNPVSDPFSALDIDLSPARSPSSLEHFNRQSDQLDTGKELSISGKLKSPLENETTNTTVATTSSKKVTSGESLNLFDISANVNTGSIDVDIRSRETHGDVVDYNTTCHMDDSARPNADPITWTSRANKKAEKAGDILLEAVSSAQPDINIEDSSRGYTDNVAQTYGVSEMKKNVEDMQQDTTSFAQPDVNIDDSTTENLKNSQGQLCQSDPSVAKDHIMDKQPTTAESGSELQNKELPMTSRKDRTKTRRPHGLRERKSFSRRQSLAVAGTHWKSGIRQSTRIRTRPLEYWKGERFLYGRVHESLTTVIGLKCISSPAKGGGEPTFKVTSYVSDEYKELVELAARH